MTSVSCHASMFYIMVDGLIWQRTRSRFFSLILEYYAVTRFGRESVEVIGRHEVEGL